MRIEIAFAWCKEPTKVLVTAHGSAAVDNVLWHITEVFPSGLLSDRTT
jgi:hypothetical protein